MTGHPGAGQAVHGLDGTGTAMEDGNGEPLVFDPAVRFSDRLERMVGTAAREAAEGLAAARSAAERIRSDVQREVAAAKAEAEGLVAARLGEAQAQATEVLTRAREQAQAILEDARAEAHVLTSSVQAQVAEARQRAQAQAERVLEAAREEGSLIVAEARDRARDMEERAQVLVVEAQATRAVTLDETQAHKQAVLAELANRSAAASEQAAALVAEAEAEAARVRQESLAEIKTLHEQRDQVMARLRALRHALTGGAASVSTVQPAEPSGDAASHDAAVDTPCAEHDDEAAVGTDVTASTQVDIEVESPQGGSVKEMV